MLSSTIKGAVEESGTQQQRTWLQRQAWKMKLPIETWHLCFSKADWSHLAAYSHENWEAHSIHYLCWQIPTFWFVGPSVYFCAGRDTNSVTLSCCVLFSSQIYSKDRILKSRSQSWSGTFYNYTTVMTYYVRLFQIMVSLYLFYT